ncbi:MAG TPA: carboxylating nicotinate-nucleotide diphosphorylase [bacterium]|mgnify:CR=1 FL=1|nr:carboxylating nicotinate-nucleotide diphosphorylase [bacterium]
MTGIDSKEIISLIEWALREDLGDAGDVTSRFTIPDQKEGRAWIVAKEDLVLAGLPVAQAVFQTVDPRITVQGSSRDGERIATGQTIAGIQGKLISILTAERTALNFMQRLSGIATMTAKFVQAVEGTGVKILDTRKTTPIWRPLEKYAVRKGGGLNHRQGLFDMILIKDNHIDIAGGIGPAIGKCLNARPGDKTEPAIEVETRTLDEVREALKYPIQRIMLDNLDPETMEEAVRLIGGKVEVEASGNVTLENIRRIARTGVDFISVGSLTHSAPAVDLSLRVETV